MKLEQWNKLKNDIVANIGDQGKITQLLADAETEVTTFNTQFDTLEKQTQEQTSQIDSLQKTNMNLFLKIGNPTQSEKVNTEKSLSYEDLFNEKGDLK